MCVFQVVQVDDTVKYSSSAVDACFIFSQVTKCHCIELQPLFAVTILAAVCRHITQNIISEFSNPNNH